MCVCMAVVARIGCLPTSHFETFEGNSNSSMQVLWDGFRLQMSACESGEIIVHSIHHGSYSVSSPFPFSTITEKKTEKEKKKQQRLTSQFCADFDAETRSCVMILSQLVVIGQPPTGRSVVEAEFVIRQKCLFKEERNNKTTRNLCTYLRRGRRQQQQQQRWRRWYDPPKLRMQMSRRGERIRRLIVRTSYFIRQRWGGWRHADLLLYAIVEVGGGGESSFLLSLILRSNGRTVQTQDFPWRFHAVFMDHFRSGCHIVRDSTG